jgi:hypothetical protein
MKVYLSYSLSPTDLHIASLLARQAQAKGLEVETSQHQHVLGTTSINTPALMSASLVIAIVSHDSRYLTTMQQELQYATDISKPVLALVERGLSSHFSVPGTQVVEFDRSNLNPALAHISAILEERKNQDNAGQWLVAGGLALLALYLFDQEK